MNHFNLIQLCNRARRRNTCLKRLIKSILEVLYLLKFLGKQLICTDSYCEPVLVENYLAQQLAMDYSSFLSSNSSHSIEEFEMEDCSNNLVAGGDVLVEETAGGVPEFVEEGDVENVSLHTVDYEDFAAGDDQHELISTSELFRIEESNACFEANIATLEHIEFLKEEEVKRLGDVALPQVNPTSEASSELVLTPLQAFQVKLINDACRLRNEEKENQAAEALFLAQQELSVTQCTGYGALQGHFVVNRVIEGLLPKINSMQLTQNWLLNKENIF